MTDLEISKALALAIGWQERQLDIGVSTVYVNVFERLRVFDYRDWNVIGPIAEKFDAFPFEDQGGWESLMTNSPMTNSDTPQKAIALAVIGAKK